MQRGAEKQEGRRGERAPDGKGAQNRGSSLSVRLLPSTASLWLPSAVQTVVGGAKSFVGPGSYALHAVASKDPPELSCLWPSAQQDPEAGSSMRPALRARTVQRKTMDSRCLWEVNKWLNFSHWDAGIIYYLDLTCLFWLSVAVWLVARHLTALIASFPKQKTEKTVLAGLL